MSQSEYLITTDKHHFDLVAVHAFLSLSYWSPGVSMATIQKSIENSLAFGILLEGKQVGFARVITDKATFAYLADVYVLEDHRGKGLAKRLLAAILDHEDLQGTRRFMLVTKDAHGLYAQFGFNELANPSRAMEKLNSSR